MTYLDAAFDRKKLHHNEETEIGVAKAYAANHQSKQNAACVKG